ncbi:transcription factor with SANT domain [Cryptosporidium ubiquitum]|uniref:Transcription factor with SANT domain n=1 Tax=Cryptosporidium ubiquitum TaxID=857276 RepID=A0A1J4MHC7_9CRYT|nr:transcription factor with SANT domain [Cryptosporidium ubiquitum]OII72245.1 transcription factor with SANT domain [Cryptosporidium ubiquitum]
MGGNDSTKGDNATLWSIVIKTAYRKRRSKRKQNEQKNEGSGLDLDNYNNYTSTIGNNNFTDRYSGDNTILNGNTCFSKNQPGPSITDTKSNGDDLLKYLLDGSPGQENKQLEDKNTVSSEFEGVRTESNSNNSFLSELFSIDKLNGDGGSKLSIDCKGDIIIEENSLNGGSGKQMDWLGLMEGRVYINENMAGTSLQPYSGAYKRTKGKRWSTEQTNKFYDALSLFGTDLMLVKSVFPEFTDKQIHDKFKAEEKKNKDKLDDILINNKKKLTKEDVLRFKQKYK